MICIIWRAAVLFDTSVIIINYIIVLVVAVFVAPRSEEVGIAT